MSASKASGAGAGRDLLEPPHRATTHVPDDTALAGELFVVDGLETVGEPDRGAALQALDDRSLQRIDPDERQPVGNTLTLYRKPLAGTGQPLPAYTRRRIRGTQYSAHSRYDRRRRLDNRGVDLERAAIGVAATGFQQLVQLIPRAGIDKPT